MTTRNERIHKHVKPHIDFSVRRSDAEEKSHYRHLPDSTEPPNAWTILDYRLDCCKWFDTEDEAYQYALDEFLGDREYTGARIQDLINHGPGKEIGPIRIYGTGYGDPEDHTNPEKQWRGYCTYPSDNPATTGDARTVDESVADLWRRVFIDPEDPQ